MVSKPTPKTLHRVPLNVIFMFIKLWTQNQKRSFRLPLPNAKQGRGRFSGLLKIVLPQGGNSREALSHALSRVPGSDRVISKVQLTGGDWEVSEKDVSVRASSLVPLPLTRLTKSHSHSPGLGRRSEAPGLLHRAQRHTA